MKVSDFTPDSPLALILKITPASFDKTLVSEVFNTDCPFRVSVLIVRVPSLEFLPGLLLLAKTSINVCAVSEKDFGKNAQR